MLQTKRISHKTIFFNSNTHMLTNIYRGFLFDTLKKFQPFLQSTAVHIAIRILAYNQNDTNVRFNNRCNLFGCLMSSLEPKQELKKSTHLKLLTYLSVCFHVFVERPNNVDRSSNFLRPVPCGNEKGFTNVHKRSPTPSIFCDNVVCQSVAAV